MDELIMFTPLNKQIKRLLSLQLAGIQKLLAENNIHLEIREDALKLIAKAGFDPQFGARLQNVYKIALERFVKSNLQVPFSKTVLSMLKQITEC